MGTNSIQLFVCFLFAAELKTELYASKIWKDHLLTKITRFQLIKHEDKEYIGQPYPDQQIEMKKLKELEILLRKELQTYCPNYSLDHLPLIIFPQQYIG